ncbi:hypothetical protein Tco_1275844 [Tanacetum coccineum]
MQTKTELILEQTQKGVSDEVLISIEGVKELKGNVKIKGEKKEALLTLRQKLGFLTGLRQQFYDDKSKSIPLCSYPTDIYKDIMNAQVHASKDFYYSDTARLP